MEPNGRSQARRRSSSSDDDDHEEENSNNNNEQPKTISSAILSNRWRLSRCSECQEVFCPCSVVASVPRSSSKSSGTLVNTCHVHDRSMLGKYNVASYISSRARNSHHQRIQLQIQRRISDRFFFKYLPSFSGSSLCVSFDFSDGLSTRKLGSRLVVCRMIHCVPTTYLSGRKQQQQQERQIILITSSKSLRAVIRLGCASV
jgi:hypothetical protein